jgi:hypothetical protein
MGDAIRLPYRWYPLRPHETQLRYAHSTHRFNVVPAGRRSGKTERAKRRLVKRALIGTSHPIARFFAAAPTRDQAKRIFWTDLKDMTKPFWTDTPSESELTIRLATGSEIVVLGLDKPERIEGSPWDGGVLDEYANMKERTWGEHVEPALADREGWCDLIGVPEGRNHYYHRYQYALAQMIEHGDASDWAAFTWTSAEILPDHIIAQARGNLDALTFQQEYEASFVNFEGRVYYTFTDASKAKLTYNPDAPLMFCLDFNVQPGIAVVAQEMTLPNGQWGTGVIGEVWIDNNSNTPAVCRKLAADWAEHRSAVLVYADASGGARGTAKVQGSDLDLAQQVLRAAFGQRLRMRVKSANPPERARVNAMNARLCSSDGVQRMYVDPLRAPHVVVDLEGVRWLKGGSGEIDKKIDRNLTHVSDALGYYVEYEFPVVDRKAKTSNFRVT